MRHKDLGLAVWHGGKWYVRRRVRRATRARRVAAVALLLLLGAVGVLAARQPSDR
jgi:hypothetical protein